MSHIGHLTKIALVSAGFGLAALGIGTGIANASPVDSGAGVPAWGHGWDGPGGGGPGWGGPGGGPGWGGPGGGPGWGGPPPPPIWNSGWNAPPPCLTGPLGFVHLCA